MYVPDLLHDSLAGHRSSGLGGEQHQEIVLTRKQGSVTLEESLARLVRENSVELAEARVRAAHPEEFESCLRSG